MGGPIDIRHFPPGRAQDVRVEGFAGTAVVMCPCGNRKPIIVPILPGAGAVGECSRCKTLWRVDKIEYLEEYGEEGETPIPMKFNVRVHGIVKKIVMPESSVQIVGRG